ncbi:MAG TPA: insulinase family protein [Opitutaceae bacterium]|nr:insulinase family protein [Opitutaceae bacterium]
MPKSFRRSCLFLWFVAALALRAATPFPHEHSDLKPDPSVRFGTLPNGLRYAVMPNHEPKGRASLRLFVNTGSLHENDNQRGIAHFLEHMAFNGSTHYAAGTLVEFFQRMGMSFGGDTNASTSFDHTVYLLELPKTDAATLAEGLRVFGDYAGGLLFPAAELDKERGVILSEKRVRDSVDFRTFVTQFEFTLGGTRFPARIPIGLNEVIEQAPRERFVEFWNTWYRPERMAVVVVGDIDAPAVEKMIVAAMSSLSARAPAAPEPDLGRITPFEGVRAHFHPEPEAPATSVSIASITPFADEPDTAATRLKYLPRDIAIAMLNRRLSVLAKTEAAPFVSAFASVSESFHFMREASVNVECKPEQWAAALAVGEQELRRALEHGFQAEELKEVVANALNGLEQAVKTAPTRRSPNLADALAQTFLDREVFTTPSSDLLLYKPAFEKITPAACVAGLRESFAAPGRYVMVTGNVKIPGDAAAAIAATYEKSRATAVTPPAAETNAEWGYTSFGPPGRVLKRDHVEDLDLTLVTFVNGVRLNLKKTDFEAGRIRIAARVGYGSMSEPRTKRGLAALAGATFNAGGLGKHSADDLRRLLAGKNVRSGFGTATDALQFSGGTTPGDLPLEFQLLAAQLTDPGYRPEALRQAQKGIEQLYLSFAHTAQGPLSTEVPNLLASGDPRFGLPAQDVLMSRTLDEIKAWLTPQLMRGPLEVSVVGDLDVEATIDAVAKTLGALPTREPKLALNDLRKVSFPQKTFAKEYTIESEIPKGVVQIYWPTTDALDIQRTRRMTLLAEIFSDRLRLKVRQELGGTYSPEVENAPSDVFPGYGFLTVSIDVDPSKAGKITEVVMAIADDLAANGATDDELERARQPVLTRTRESLRTNGYWLGSVLLRAQEKPEVLEWARTRIADLEGIKAAEINALAKTYLPSARAFRVTVLPATAAAAAATGSAAPPPLLPPLPAAPAP